MSAATHPEVAPENQHDGTVAPDPDLKAGRRQVARSRGVLSGILLLLLGAWAALAPFIGPYFEFGYQPRSGDAWHWTSGRGLYEVLPGGLTALAGLVLLFSTSRILTVLLAWLAALAGAWLVIAPVLAPRLTVDLGTPPTGANADKTVALQLLYFFATGAAIAVIAGIAIGRLSVHSVRDVRAAERRAEAAAAAAAAAEAQRLEAARQEAERQEAARQEAARQETARQEAERLDAERRDADRLDDSRTDHSRADNSRIDNSGADDIGATTTSDRRDDDRYAAPSAGPYEPAGNRDTAGSSGYSGYAGHRPSGQHSAAPDAPPLDETGYRTESPSGAPSGAHADDAVHDPAAPPPPGATEQYRYATRQDPAPPHDHQR